MGTTSADAGTVTLTNDDTVTGTITRQTDDTVTVDHPDLGVLNIPAANVAGVELEETDPIYVEPPKPDFFWGWDKSLQAGLTGSNGNSDSVALYAAFATDYEDDTDRWFFRARVFYTEEDSVNTRNEYDFSLTKDWLIPDEPLFYWANAKYEFDEFTGYEERASGFAGLGYEVVDRDDYNLLFRFGGGGNWEGGAVEEFTPEIQLSLEGEWDIDQNSSLGYYTFFYPSLEPVFSEFRNVSGLVYKMSVDKSKGLSLNVGAESVECFGDGCPAATLADLQPITWSVSLWG
ncbi:MAG: DUF481 domain-containing protein, partial [Planctomycetota bacterium]